MRARVYLDTNIFIAAFEAVGEIRECAWQVLDAAERDQIEIVTSELTLAELLSKPPSDDPTILEQYEAMMSSRFGFGVVPVRRDILLKAAEIRRTQGQTKLPDAIHLATAELTGCSCLLTGDLRLRNRNLPVLQLEPGIVTRLNEVGR